MAVGWEASGGRALDVRRRKEGVLCLSSHLPVCREGDVQSSPGRVLSAALLFFHVPSAGMEHKAPGGLGMSATAEPPTPPQHSLNFRLWILPH